MSDSVEAVAVKNDLRVRLDKAAKSLLRLKSVQAAILQGVVPELAKVSREDIIQHHLVGAEIADTNDAPYAIEHVNEGTATEDVADYSATINYDAKIKVRIKEGETADCFVIVDFEAQNSFSPGYSLVRRAEFYMARMLAAQLPIIKNASKGTEKDTKYDRLSKVYSVWICFDPPKGSENSYTSIRFQQTQVFGHYEFDEREVDMEEAVFLLLGDDDTENELLSFLNILFSKTLDSQEKLSKLKTMGFPVADDSFVKGVANMTVEEMTYFESRFRAGRDVGKAEGREEGKAEGKAEGKTEGLREGKTQRQRELAKLSSLMVECGRLTEFLAALSDENKIEHLLREFKISS